LFGAGLIGAVVVPLSTFSPKPELSYLLGHYDVSALLLQTSMGSREFAADLADLVKETVHPYLRHVAALGSESWDAFLARGDEVDDGLVDAVSAQVHPVRPRPDHLQLGHHRPAEGCAAQPACPDTAVLGAGPFVRPR
jgi:fatty-acyl-CoA synthase